MIDIDNWMRELEEEEDIEIKNNEEYQTKLFEEYVLRGSDHQEERRKLNERYLSGEELMGEHGLRKELAAFDMSYFGRAYLPHYFIRKSPHFHEELDEIWSRGVMKGRNPLKEAKVISRLKGSRQVVAAPRGHAKSTNFTFKDSLHAILYAYKHYILILSDSSEQAEGFLDDIKTELEDNANIIMDFGSLKGDKAWRTGVILTKTDIKAEAIGSGKKVRGRRHRNWRPDLIVLDDIENDENVNTPEQRRKLKNWFDKAVSKAGDTYTDIMYIGTILHYDSLLNNVLQNPRYKTKKYRAVISEAVNTKLWDEWESIYTKLLMKQRYRMQPCEEAYSIRKTLEQYRMVIDYFDYLKLNGLWKLTGSRLMDAQRTEYTTKQAYSFGVEHTREFRVIWHEEHNLIFLDGTWSLDGSKIIDAWQKTEVL